MITWRMHSFYLEKSGAVREAKLTKVCGITIPVRDMRYWVLSGYRYLRKAVMVFTDS